ncbi:uncharacterized protein LOC107474337 isoform X1 [Arachis duranensis]|uniref:Uncharacterized protein LOC107474337 isoform X1 n=1 Tax=Arachis duranensis TaxID=130453 RepID=A0A9C6TQ23_ARADU|nr:uncharacterized protein LOC107474337 isoform X1 [Arachis duranensis]QHO53243.1 uncharacterized protein DS421_2g46170 [Arachis hypogaea]
MMGRQETPPLLPPGTATEAYVIWSLSRVTAARTTTVAAAGIVNRGRRYWFCHSHSQRRNQLHHRTFGAEKHHYHGRVPLPIRFFKSGFCPFEIPGRLLILRSCTAAIIRDSGRCCHLKIIDRAAAGSTWNYGCFACYYSLSSDDCASHKCCGGCCAILFISDMDAEVTKSLSSCCRDILYCFCCCLLFHCLYLYTFCKRDRNCIG